MSNKLNGLTLEQAAILRSALEQMYPVGKEQKVDYYYLLAQLHEIIKQLRGIKHESN